MKIILPFILVLSWNGKTPLTAVDGLFPSSKLEKTMTHHSSNRLRPARKLRIYEARDTPALTVANNPTLISAVSSTGGPKHYTVASPSSEHTGSDSSSFTYKSEGTTGSDTSSSSESSMGTGSSLSSTSEEDTGSHHTSTSESGTGSDTSSSSHSVEDGTARSGDGEEIPDDAEINKTKRSNDDPALVEGDNISKLLRGHLRRHIV